MLSIGIYLFTKKIYDKLMQSLFSMEFSDLLGRPVFPLCLSASCTPSNTDESTMYHWLETDNLLGLLGSLTRLLTPLPGYCLVLVLDRGFE